MPANLARSCRGNGVRRPLPRLGEGVPGLGEVAPCQGRCAATQALQETEAGTIGVRDGGTVLEQYSVGGLPGADDDVPIGEVEEEEGSGAHVAGPLCGCPSLRHRDAALVGGQKAAGRQRQDPSLTGQHLFRDQLLVADQRHGPAAPIQAGLWRS